MSNLFEVAHYESGVPYIARVFLASSGEKFYAKVYQEEADKGLTSVPLSVVNSYLEEAHKYILSVSSQVELVPLEIGDPGRRFPGFKNLIKVAEMGEEASGWWGWAERNYYDLIEGEASEENV